MTTYNWTISTLECAPSEDGLENVIKTVHWQCAGTDGEHSASVYATCSLPSPSDEFIVFADITKEQVLEWIWENGVNKQVTEDSIQSQIETQKNPPIVKPALPWL
jgi:hypothetical protein